MRIGIRRHRTCLRQVLGAVALMGLACCQDTARADWPTYRADAQRSGFTKERLPAQLAPHWTFRAPTPPAPAWKKHETRMTYDHAFHPVVAGGHVLFGSSGDDTVYALDVGTGRVRWTHTTSGPIRFAPTIWRQSVFVVSDDGCLYSLSLDSGGLNWRLRAGPTDSRVLGNDRVISRWAPRGAPVVMDDTVYFAAGLWPSEGFFLRAVDAATGQVKWLNDESGQVMPAQPGAGTVEGGVSAQGYLAAWRDSLIVPTGRSVPAVFRRSDGRLVYSRGRKHHWHIGGPDVVVFGDHFLNDYLVFDAASGQQDGRLSTQFKEADGRRHWSGRQPNLVVAHPGGLVKSTGQGLLCFDVGLANTTDRKGQTRSAPDLALAREWKTSYGGRSLAMAGTTLISAGPDQEHADGVSLIDIDSGAELARWPVEGVPDGLAVGGERLFVSTSEGLIHCFGRAADAPPQATAGAASAHEPAPGGASPQSAWVRRLLDEAGADRGYGVVLGAGQAEVALALAQQSALHIVAVDPDPENVRAARERLRALNLYGSRVSVLQAPLDATDLPSRFANLVVAPALAADSQQTPLHQEARRLVRPYGGALCLGRGERFTLAISGALEGAGQWTHQYADPGNTAISDDDVVRAPLGMVWFTDHGWHMPSRHGRGPSPLCLDGRLYIEGLNGILCADAFNGTALWEYRIPGVLRAYDAEHILGTAGTGSNFCVGPAGLFVREGSRCHRIDRETGRLIADYEAPAMPDGTSAPWGHIALSDGVLFGTLADPEHVVKYPYGQSDMRSLLSESRLLFAMDAQTGSPRWTFAPRESIRHNAIAVGREHVYLIDRPQALQDRLKAAAARRGATESAEPAPGRLLALRISDGTVAWQAQGDIYGTLLIHSVEHDALLMAYQRGLFQLPSEVGGRMSVFRASTGDRLWEKAVAYQSRPAVNGRTIYAQSRRQGDADAPCAWDLLTGAPHDFRFSRYRSCCGTVSGCRNLLMFRSAEPATYVNALAYVDLIKPQGTEKFAGLRPGCWLNAIAAGGMVLMPDASDRCSCSFHMKASIALQHLGARPPRIVPSGAVFVRSMQVRLESDVDGVPIHYTADGSSPSSASPRYAGPITLTDSVTLRARVLGRGMPPGPIARAGFTMLSRAQQEARETARRLEDAAEREAARWLVHDAAGGNPSSSQWVVAGDVVVEKSNLYAPPPVGPGRQRTEDAERPGTYRLWRQAPDMGAGTLTVDLGSSDNDTLGVVFRFRDTGHFYVWYMDGRPFHRLAVRDGDQYRVLAVNERGYTQGAWHQLKIVLDGGRIAIWFDGEKDFEVTDNAVSGGTYGMYAWGCAGAKFRNMTWTPAAAEEPAAPADQ